MNFKIERIVDPCGLERLFDDGDLSAFWNKAKDAFYVFWIHADTTTADSAAYAKGTVGAVN